VPTGDPTGGSPDEAAEPTAAEVEATQVEAAGASTAEPGGLRRAWPWLRWPVFGAAGLLAVVLVLGAWLWVTTDLPPARSVGASAVLLDASGEELAVLAQEGLRLEVPLDDMAPAVVDALIAAEDQRFYEHTGVDPLGIGRAVWNNLTADSTQGGSTITQQLVKNAYLTSDRTFTRKLREAVLAVKLERNEDKDHILERYLNTVYFGRGAYGIEAAARSYFDTSAADLAPEQAALLVGLLPSPNQLDPAVDLDRSQARRDAVLEAMAELGTLEAAEAQAAASRPVEVIEKTSSPTTLRAGVAPHFVEHVRALLVDELGERALYEDGLVVQTTLDLTDQRAAEAAVAAHLDDPADPQVALVAIDRSGAVKAWVGGRDFEALQVDLVAGAGGSGRQPGSTFKTVTLAATFEQGNGAGEPFPAPAEITLDVDGEPWTVGNADGRDHGTMTLAQAMVGSVNTVYAQATLQVGAPAVVEMAERLGVRRELRPEPAIGLGTEEVTTLELATVYSTLSRSGVRIDPYLITSVEDADGRERWDARPEEDQVVEPRIADTVSAVLAEVPRSGTARRAALDRPMAAKTGTTQRNADAWLAGYTPEYTAVVWVGNPDSNEPIPPVDGQQVQGGTVPAEIWHDFMVEALADVPPTPFPEPDPELLSDTSPPLELAASSTVEPGGTVEVRGNGFQLCRSGWWAVLEGPAEVDPADAREPEAVFIESAPDVGSDEAGRRAELRMPVTAVAGTYQVSARCDSGGGAQPLGPTATVRVPLDPANTTTTTTEPEPEELPEPPEEPDGPGREGEPGPPTTTTTTTEAAATEDEDDG
jgi:penicillin-binding protein 1A